jgi:hypothetical protein
MKHGVRKPEMIEALDTSEQSRDVIKTSQRIAIVNLGWFHLAYDPVL